MLTVLTVLTVPTVAGRGRRFVLDRHPVAICEPLRNVETPASIASLAPVATRVALTTSPIPRGSGSLVDGVPLAPHSDRHPLVF